MLKDLLRICPICGEHVGRVMTTINLAPLEGENLPLQFDVVSCVKCLFCFDDSEARQEDFDKYYSTTIKYTTEGTYGSGGFSAYDTQRYEEAYQRIYKYISPSSRILEIGAGKCGFLAHLSSKGFKNLFAIEPSGACTASCDVQPYSTFENLYMHEQKPFDFIISAQTFEHIFDLSNIMKQIHSVLSKDGKFYVDVPDAALYKQMFKAPFHYFDREHINHFTLKSLNNFFHVHGYHTCYAGKFSEIYNCVFGIFAFDGKQREVEPDIEADAIIEYCNISKSKEDFTHLIHLSTPIVLWGLGAYLRRIIVKEDFPKNIEAIIDRDRGGKGDFWNGIPLVTAEVLTKAEFSNATVIITSALYAEEIKNQLATMKFAGKVLMAF